jgi:subtilase family serine protease
MAPGSGGGGAGGGGYSDVFGVPSWQASAVGSPGAGSGQAAAAHDKGLVEEVRDLVEEVVDEVAHRHKHPTPPGGPAPAPAGARGRGVPDVAGNADPVTGYKIVANGQGTSVGGTSAVAPLWAGLIARLAQASGKRFGLVQPLIYAGVTAGTPAPGFNDVTIGNNGAYQAVAGWDPCTGLGSPNALALVKILANGAGA